MLSDTVAGIMAGIRRIERAVPHFWLRAILSALLFTAAELVADTLSILLVALALLVLAEMLLDASARATT